MREITAFRSVLILCSIGLQLCLSGCYVLQAAQGQLAITSKREPIADVIANSNTSAAVQRRLQLIADAREFASRELALPDN